MAPPPGAALAAADRRLRSPVLVGRDAELARAVGVVSVPPSVVVIAGESGIGKTRLVTELRRHRNMSDRRFVVGWCRRIREPFPLGPVLEAVRCLRDELAMASLSPVVGALRPLLPELAALLPEQPPLLDDRAAERHRVFRGLAEVLSVGGPLVLVLEDLHWADDQTVDFVSYLLGDPPDRLSLVVTYRSEDVAARVRALTAKVPEQVSRADLGLAPLGRDQAGVLAAALLGVDRVTDRFADDLFDRTSGSPFAIEELLLLLRERGGPDGSDDGRMLAELDVPVGIRDPVLERLGRLSSDARPVVEAAAVLQAPADADLFAAMCMTSRSSATRGMTEALVAGVLVEPEGAVGFRHLLAAQAVYGQIPGPLRADLHARAAPALLASDPTALGQAAHHLRCSGQLAAWADAAEKAADRAVEFGHDDEAAPLFADLLRHAPLGGERRGRVAVKLARASIESLQMPNVEPLFEALEADLPRVVEGELRLLAAITVDWTNNADRPRRLCGQAVADLADRPSLQAWAMACLGMPVGYGVPVSDHLRWVDRSLAIVPQVDDPSMAMGVVGKAASTLVEVGDWSWRRVQDQFIERAGGGSKRREAYAYRCHGLAVCLAGHHLSADRLLSQALDGALDCENPRLELAVREARAVLALCTGAWAGAEEELARQPDRHLPDGLSLVRGCLALAQGHHEDAWLRLSTVARTLEQGWVWRGAIATSGLVRMALARGDIEAASHLTQRLRSALESKRMWAPLARALPVMVRAELAAGRTAEAAGLMAVAEAELSGLDSPLAAPALHVAHGVTLATAGRAGEAARRFLAAADQYGPLRCPYEAAQAREQAAVCLFSTAARDAGAAPQLESALDTYQRLGATWDLDRAASLARRHGVSVPARHRGGRRGYGQELSPREAEVARLAGAGRTNAEIAAELFLSVSTVKKHLAAALRKLGVPSRPALVRRLSADGEFSATNNGPAGP